ncbi:hypothetical protein L249_4542 [Ophiocordyceps polyrhachis-furcata BCC 54312]|uniref:Uncharacterized protein n=1 Tax=Ophiocordyceps polyrhachis-furcata BCC 54312 TaxID=1330021 RepID=A0A367KZ29_9HYPO|nr:hypothetical protein L249_4542 [Ophiocordyceps polyrhachis-furcata BCC 54312]
MTLHESFSGDASQLLGTPAPYRHWVEKFKEGHHSLLPRSYVQFCISALSQEFPGLIDLTWIPLPYVSTT